MSWLTDLLGNVKGDLLKKLLAPRENKTLQQTLTPTPTPRESYMVNEQGKTVPRPTERPMDPKWATITPGQTTIKRTTQEPTPTPRKQTTKDVTLKDGARATVWATPYDDLIDNFFGGVSDEARRVLKWEEGQGENPQYNTGKGWVSDKGQHEDYNYDENYPWGEVLKYVSSKTGKRGLKETDSDAVPDEDRGLFRINSGTFYDLMRRKKDIMEALGITNYDDMFDVELNIKMAKLIQEEQGWKAWHAAPDDLKDAMANLNILNILGGNTAIA